MWASSWARIVAIADCELRIADSASVKLCGRTSVGWRGPMATGTSILGDNSKRTSLLLSVRLATRLDSCCGAGAADRTRRWAARLPRTSHAKTQAEPREYTDTRMVGHEKVDQNGGRGGAVTGITGTSATLSLTIGGRAIGVDTSAVSVWIAVTGDASDRGGAADKRWTRDHPGRAHNRASRNRATRVDLVTASRWAGCLRSARAPSVSSSKMVPRRK